MAATSPFPNFAAASDRAFAPAAVDRALCDQLLALVDTEPEAVAKHVRAWLTEDDA